MEGQVKNSLGTHVYQITLITYSTLAFKSTCPSMKHEVPHVLYCLPHTFNPPSQPTLGEERTYTELTKPHAMLGSLTAA